MQSRLPVCDGDKMSDQDIVDKMWTSTHDDIKQREWREHFLEMAILVATRSKDPSTQVGAVITDTERRVLGMGYNGFPRYVNDDPKRYEDREMKLRMVVHAEVNAVLNARGSVVGGILYTTRAPCCSCAGVLIQSGISTVVTPDQPANSKWIEDWMISKQMLTEAGVTIHYQDLPRYGKTMEEYYEDGLRQILPYLRRQCVEACNSVMNIHAEGCREEMPDMAEDTISRLLRGKSI